MRWFSSLALLAVMAVPLSASGQDLQIGADAGATRFLDGGPRGFGVNVYPGVTTGPITLELQLGYQRGEMQPALGSGTSHITTYVPAMAGGRAGLVIGIVRPWAGAHGGFAYVGRTTEHIFSGFRHTNDEWEPAFNVGAGIDFAVGAAAIGAGGWYNVVMDPDDPLRTLTIGVTVAVRL